jgi:hypothetical protein
MIMSKLD